MGRAAPAALLGLLAAAGCGYALVDYPKRADAPAVAVATFENASHQPGYEFVVADALRREFARRGALRLAPDPDAAQLVVQGRIDPIVTEERSFSSVVLALEYQLTVSLELALVRRDETLPVDARVLTERDLYLASADVEALRKNRSEALRRIADVLAARIHDIVYEVAP